MTNEHVKCYLSSCPCHGINLITCRLVQFKPFEALQPALHEGWILIKEYCKLLSLKKKQNLSSECLTRWAANKVRKTKKVTHIFPAHLTVEMVKQGPLGFTDLTVNNRLGDSILQRFRYHANVWGHIRSNPPEVCISVTIIWRRGRVCSSRISSSSLFNFLWELAEELHRQICWLHINQP